MSVITQRAFTRNQYRAPIRFSGISTKDSHEGEMINSSVGGMGFLSEQELKPGEGIYIEMVDVAPDPYWLEPKEDYYAEVRWCMKKDAEETTSYQVGVRFLVDTCRLCDKTIHRRMNGTVDLCEACYEHVCSLSEGTIKDCIQKYLMGNIL